MIQFFSHPNAGGGVDERRRPREGGGGVDEIGEDGVEEGLDSG